MADILSLVLLCILFPVSLLYVAGCDRLTISPQLLAELAKDEGPLARRLDPNKVAL